MRIVFFGTPHFAVPTLEALAREHEVALVVAQPDKPAGRGMKMQAPPVVAKARELGLSVAQPSKIRDASFLESIKALRPDAGVVVAYGRILPAALLEIPKRGFLNVHASLLPKYRGAAPIQRAIETGESTTGVTIMRVDEELDHGPILTAAEAPIAPHERSPALAARLAALGAQTLVDALARLDSLVETPQDHAHATFAPKIEKREGLVDWNVQARTIYDRFRAFDPWPGLFTADLKLIEIEPIARSGKNGTILEIDDRGVVVAAAEGSIRLLTVQRAGKPRVAAADLARGSGWRVGGRL